MNRFRIEKKVPRYCFSNHHHNKMLSEWFIPTLLLEKKRQKHRCEINEAKQQAEGTVKSLFYYHNEGWAFPTVSLSLLIQYWSVKASAQISKLWPCSSLLLLTAIWRGFDYTIKWISGVVFSDLFPQKECICHPQLLFSSLYWLLVSFNYCLGIQLNWLEKNWCRN